MRANLMNDTMYKLMNTRVQILSLISTIPEGNREFPGFDELSDGVCN